MIGSDMPALQNNRENRRGAAVGSYSAARFFLPAHAPRPESKTARIAPLHLDDPSRLLATTISPAPRSMVQSTVRSLRRHRDQFKHTAIFRRFGNIAAFQG